MAMAYTVYTLLFIDLHSRGSNGLLLESTAVRLSSSDEGIAAAGAGNSSSAVVGVA